MMRGILFFNAKEPERNTGDRGATLIEVIITVVVIAIFLAGAYQFLLLMNARSKSQIADQELNDRINLFFGMITRDFRNARRVSIVEGSGQCTIDIEVPDGSQVSYVFQNGEILKNGTRVVWGISGTDVSYVKTSPEPGGKIPFVFYSELHISIFTPADTYDLSVVRRNPPEGDE